MCKFTRNSDPFYFHGSYAPINMIKLKFCYNYCTYMMKTICSAQFSMGHLHIVTCFLLK